ncbi:MAG: hypothetical protein V2I43_06815 [Parvularcula sp.]|jgi:hypothetical protein|nr:hypothetical protein [Parvularcula sp.]
MTQKPEDTIRDGNIKASIWRNEGEKGPYFATTITRTYRDAAGNYQETASLVGTDLLRASELARSAYNRSRELMTEEREANGGSQSKKQGRFGRRNGMDQGPSR